MDYVHAIEKELNKKATYVMLPLQPGDVPATYADTAVLQHDFSYCPKTSVADGVARFVAWYRVFYNV
jgi:UDP-glucuronate 4-epimerase